MRHRAVCRDLRVALIAAVTVLGAGCSPALAGEFAYVANLLSSSVSVIDTRINSLVTSIPVGLDPDGVAAAPNGTSVYVANFRSDTVSVIDTATNAVTATIAVAGGPIGLAVTPDSGSLYVASKKSDTISVVDTRTNSVVKTIAFGPGHGPNAVAITPEGAFAYVTNSRLTRTVSVIDTKRNVIVATIPVGVTPNRIAISPDGFAYVTDFDSATVSVIDTRTKLVVATVPVSEDPTAIAISPVGESRVRRGLGGSLGHRCTDEYRHREPADGQLVPGAGDHAARRLRLRRQL